MIYAEHIISHVNVQNASGKSHLRGKGRSVEVLGLVLGSEGGVDSSGGGHIVDTSSPALMDKQVHVSPRSTRRAGYMEAEALAFDSLLILILGKTHKLFL
jgi:hypothetical protein